MPAFTPSCRASPPFGRYSLCLPTEGWPGWVDLESLSAMVVRSEWSKTHQVGVAAYQTTQGAHKTVRNTWHVYKRGLDVIILSHNSSKTNKSTITDHEPKQNHVINWSGAKILYRESQRKSKTAQGIYLHTKTDCINRDVGANNLPTTYDCTLVTCSSSSASRDYMPDELSHIFLRVLIELYESVITTRDMFPICATQNANSRIFVQN